MPAKKYKPIIHYLNISGWVDGNGTIRATVVPEERPSIVIQTGPVTKIKYYNDGNIKELHTQETLFRAKPRPRGRPRKVKVND